MTMTIGCPIPGASQPKEPVRLIDANALINKAIYIVAPRNSGCHAVPVGLIENAPTIDPESLRPTAKWVEALDEGADASWEACSKCAWEAKWAASQYNYCPHCGAKMVNSDE